MASIDERVVSMAFDNAAFERGVAQTLGTLGKLDAAIKNLSTQNLAQGLGNIENASQKVTLEAPVSALGRLKGAIGKVGSGAATGFSAIESAASKVNLLGPLNALDKLRSRFSRGVTPEAQQSFSEVEKASDKVSLSGLTRAIQQAGDSFTFLEHIAANALGGIATNAALKGANFAKSFAFGPLNQGFEEYGTNLNSIQTILANTEGQQVSGLQAVQDHLGELNTYSDQTIYNFSEMAKNIGTFTAAGVDLDTSTQSIKGIANLAALSGSNSQQASTAMYQLSQAIAAGRVGLQDWNSVVNAGMGGAKFQQALMRTASNMGTIKDGALEIDKATGKATVNGESFRESIMAKPGEESWLTSEVLTQTLSQFTGDMKESDLVAQGYTKTQAQAIMQQAKTAKAAATEVKTLSQAFDVARESIGSGWSQTFQLIFGNFEQSKKTFTEFSNAMNGIIGRISDARNNLLKQFNALGGREQLIRNFKSLFMNLGDALKIVGDAFRDIFPPTTAKDLMGLMIAWRDFNGHVAIFLQKNGPALKSTLKGVFAVVHIVWTVVKQLVGTIFDLLGAAGGGASGFLEFTGSLGEFLVKLDKAISSGESLGNVFDGITTVLKQPIALLQFVGGLIADLFGKATGGQSQDLEGRLETLYSKLGPLADVLKAASAGLETFWEAIKKVANFLEPIFSDAVDAVSSFAGKVKGALQSINFDDLMQALTTVGIGGIFLTLRKALGGGVNVSFFDNVKESVVETLDEVNGSLGALQQNIKANTLLQIAVAIAALAAGVLILSKIDPGDLAKAMTAVAVGLGELVGALKLLGTAGGAVGLAMMPLIGAAMIELAIAVGILSLAVTKFSELSWEELVKGLVGVAGVLTAVGVGVQLMPKRLILIGPALIPIAIALNIMAGAMKIFATMSWEDMAKGLAGVGFGLDFIGRATTMMGPSLKLVGPGLVAVGVSLLLLSVAIGAIGNMDIMTIGKGLLGIGGGLLIIAAAVGLMPPTMIAQAAGLVVLAVALNGIGMALAVIGNLRIATLAKGLIAIALALDIFALGLTAMSSTLPGAAALLLAAAGLAVLTPVLITMGNLDWGTILKGLAAMSLSIGVIAVVATAAGPPLVVLGLGLAALGVGLLAIGGSIYLVAKGMSLLSESGQKGFAALLAAITGFVALIPTILIQFVKGLVSVVEEVAKVAPKVAMALGVIIDTVLATIIEQAPKLAIAAGSLIDAFLEVIVTRGPQIIAAGLGLLVNFLEGINNNIGKVTENVGQIIGKFLGQLSVEAPKIVAAGARLLVTYLKGIANNLPKVIAAAGQVLISFFNGVARELPKVYAAGFRAIVRFLDALADGIPKVIRGGTNVIISFLEGLSKALPRIVEAAVDVVVRFIRAVGRQAPRIADAGFKALIDFLEGLAKAIRENNQDLLNAGLDIAKAIVDGIVNGLGVVARRVVKPVVEKLFDLLPGFAKKLLGIKSPSTVFAEIGKNVMLGFAFGVEDNGPRAFKAMSNVLQQLINTPQELRQFGQFLGGEFMDGLDGAMTEGPTGRAGVIEDSFSKLRDRFKTEQGKLREDIKSDREKLATELDKDNPSEKVVIRLQKDINANVKLLGQSKAATKALMDGLKDEKAQLLGLAASYDQVTSDLDKAQTELDRLVGLRESMKTSLRDQYSDLPDFDVGLQEAMDEAELTYQQRAEKRREREKEAQKRAQIDQVALYKAALQKQIEDTRKFRETLDKLRELGLDDTTYERLAKQGTGAQAFAEQLLRGGKGGIDQLKSMGQELTSEAVKISDMVSTEFHKAGIEAAQTFVNELKAKQADLEVQMEALGGAVVRGIKKALGIKSPSRVLAEVGQNTAQGLIDGLRRSAGAVAAQATSVGETAAGALTQSLSRISEAVTAEIDVDPTITPVLDLTQVRRDASELSNLTNVVPITAAASYGQAATISGETAATQEAAAAAAAVTQFNFEQNNYSPEALSDIEIYRQTNNQLSQVKQALGLATA